MYSLYWTDWYVLRRAVLGASPELETLAQRSQKNYNDLFIDHRTRIIYWTHDHLGEISKMEKLKW